MNGGIGSGQAHPRFKELFEQCLRQAGLNTRTLHERYERQTSDFLHENTIASWRNPHSTTGQPNLPGEEKLARVARWLCAQGGVTVTEAELLEARRTDKAAQVRRRRESYAPTGVASGSGFPALRSLDRYPHNLPVPLTRFIGRDAEIERLRRELSASRLCTLTGKAEPGLPRAATLDDPDRPRHFDRDIHGERSPIAFSGVAQKEPALGRGGRHVGADDGWDQFRMDARHGVDHQRFWPGAGRLLQEGSVRAPANEPRS